MSKAIVPGLLGVIYWLVLSASPAVAAGGGSLGCNSTEVTGSTARIAGGAYITQETGAGLQGKGWAPQGDAIRFTIKSFDSIPKDASVLACFRWSSSSGDFIQVDPSQTELSADGKQLIVTVTIPNDLGRQPANIKTVKLLGLPLVEVRLLAIAQGKDLPLSGRLPVNIGTEIGITRPLVAFLVAIVAMIVGLFITYCVKRPSSPGITKARWYLQIISTKDGFASLSQLQVVLWTFVVATSAVYVMVLSGRLVEITPGTLILLGIAGAAGVGAGAHNAAQIGEAQTAAKSAEDASVAAKNAAAQATAAQAQKPTDPNQADALAQKKVAADEDAAKKEAEAKRLKDIAERLKNPPTDQIPSWSDLLVNQTVTETGVVTQEIDVTRLQMLLFTLVTAVFVLITVLTTYVIPEIPTGFLTLMGISNGVYLGSKVVQS